MTGYATSFTTQFGTALQGMQVTWGNTYASGTTATNINLSLDIVFNFYAVDDMNTNLSTVDANAALNSDGASWTPFVFYLSFLNT